MFFLGSDSPFLLEHIHRYGTAIHGDRSILPAPLWVSSQRVEWIRSYLPFHMVTFRRRLEYGWTVLNFCQLVSLRVILKTGEVVTDGPALRSRCIEQSRNEGNPETEVIDFLSEVPADSPEVSVYDPALVWVSKTYNHGSGSGRPVDDSAR